MTDTMSWSRRALWLTAATMVVAGASPVGAQAPSPSAAVTAAVQVTANPAPVRFHNTPQIARNPTNGELVVVESDVRGSRKCSVHVSTDSGRTWAAGGDPMVEPVNDCGFYGEYGPYATLAFGKNGDLYVAFVASEFLNRARNDTPRHVFLARSTDSGRSFDTTRVFDAPDGNPDRGLNKGPMLAVDPNAPERVYVGWRQGIFAANAKEKLKTNVAASADGGRTFGPPVELTDERGGDYPGLAVDGDGTVHAVYWTRAFPPGPSNTPGPPRPIQYVRSTDRGRTWSKGETIDPGNQSTPRPPMLAADPKSSAVYMVWYTNAEVNNQAPGFEGFHDVYLRASKDGGRTWGERVTVNDDRSTANQFEPGVSIAPNGRLDISWYDFRHNPVPPVPATGQGSERGLSDIYYASSSDKGDTVSPNVRITDRGADRSLGGWKFDSKFNVGISSSNDAVYFAWQDPRNAIRDTDAEDVYAASLVLDGRTADGSGSGDDGVPSWLLLGAGLTIGMGLTMALVWRLRKARP
ncbi:MAG: glycoside hydrolase [Actinomycetota bacterium]|nr:glycoside hydrolase [Actinomycetota bacterium]